mgnify:FL=1
MASENTAALMDARAARALDLEQQYQRIMKHWLKGYTTDEIMVREGITTPGIILTAINVKRGEIAAAQADEITNLTAERIAGMRLIKKEAHDYLEFIPDKAPQLLGVALKAEENIAKLQGLLSDKVMHIGRIDHTVKHYNFDDKSPPPLIDGPIIQGQVISISEPELPSIEPEIEVQLITDDTVLAQGTTILPDGQSIKITTSLG